MAKPRAYGSDAQLIGIHEATYGTAPNGGAGGVYKKLSFASYSLGAEKPLGYDPLLGQGRDAQDPHYEAVSAQGDVVVPLDLQGIGFWLAGLFGAPVTTGTDPYTHVFTSGGELASFALELGHMALSTKHVEQATGVKCGGLSFDMARTGPANGTIPLIAQGVAEFTAAEDASPVAYALTRFNRSRGTISVDASQLANVTGGQFEFSNGLEPIETIRSDGLIDGVDETEATARGSVTVRFGTDTTLRDAIDAETPVALEYEFTIPGSDGYALTFALPRVFLPRVKQQVNGPGGVEVTYDWQAAYDSSDGHLLEVTLVNDVASYALS